MKLSKLIGLEPDLELIHDGEFDGLGMITSEGKEKRILSFLSDEKYADSIGKNTSIKGIILTKDLFNQMEVPKGLGVLLSPKPKEFFFTLHNRLAEEEFYWRKWNNEISPTAKVSDHAVIGDHSITIGENCIIEPHVVIHPGTVIGNQVIIRSGSQIGSNGFQFIHNGSTVLSVKTAGRVIIKDEVEIQHNCCVDRGVLGGDTILEPSVKLDNFVHVAHDDLIGTRTFITAGVKLAGRVTIGKDCWLGVNATISNGITIGDHCKVSLGAVVTRDVPSHTVVTGNFAIEHRKFIEFIKRIR